MSVVNDVCVVFRLVTSLFVQSPISAHCIASSFTLRLSQRIQLLRFLSDRLLVT